jgi:serine/threonine protein kinase
MSSPVDDLLSRWRHDPRLTPEELCRDCPEVLPELRLRIAVGGPVQALPDEAIPARSGHQDSGPESAGDTRPLGMLGGYQLHGELGRGGMGVVYRALDPRLQRLVAIKVLLPWGSEAMARQRFLDEARLVAQLDHPHIARVYHSGEENGQLWFAMEYIAGGSLANALGEGPRDTSASARLVLLLARAVQHAHDAGIIHRDLKPGNVLLAPPADEPTLNTAWGCPKISDFGLAREVDSLRERTQTGQVVGTLDYLAPEQAQGKREVGPQADVYALGGILYRLLTGQVPFREKGLFATLEKIVHEPPTPVSNLVRGIPAELEAICLKCLAKSPAERFASAADLAAALAGFLTGEARAKPSIPRRKRPWRLAGGLVALAGCVALVVVLWARGRQWPDVPNPSTGEKLPADLNPSLVVKVFNEVDKPWLPIDHPAALPARSTDLVRIEVNLDRPAYSYLLLLTSQGEAVPLYPWNEGPDLEVLNVDAPPPVRREAKWSNPRKANRGWEMDDKAGLETLLLLVREEPLPAGMSLRGLLGEIPAGKKAPLRDRGETVLLGLERGAKESRTLLELPRGIRKLAREVDEPIAKLMGRLQEMFPVQRVARFAHVRE